MHQIDHSTAAPFRPPRLPAGSPGWFTDGSAAGGIPFTILLADFLNMWQAEMLAILAEAGIDPDKDDDTQLVQSFLAIADERAAAQATESVRGAAKVATALLARGWSADDVMLTPVKLVEAFKGSRQSLTVNGFQMEPGGVIKQWGVTALLGVEDSLLVTLPIPFPTAFFGALAVPIGTNGGGVTAAVCNPVDLASFTLYSDSSGGGASHMFYWEARGK